MSTEQGPHTRKCAPKNRNRHRMRPAPVGTRPAMSMAWINADPSTRVRWEKIARDQRLFWAHQLSMASQRLSVVAPFLASDNLLERQNAELLVHQARTDQRTAERMLGITDLDQTQTDRGYDYETFLNGVVFDRADDVWPYRAERGRGIKTKVR